MKLALLAYLLGTGLIDNRRVKEGLPYLYWAVQLDPQYEDEYQDALAGVEK